MDSYTIDQLSDEVFGHLCNIAIDKCNDKMEKRRAGCGGRAMRKRVLIKNFVSELMRVQNDRDQELCDEEITEEIPYEEDRSLESLLPEDGMEFDDDLPKSDLWLGGTSQLEDNYSDYLGDSLLNSHDAENKTSSRPASRLGLYDLFSGSPTEQASEGGKPEAILPEGFMHTVPAHAYDSFAAYDLGAPVTFELEELTYSPLSDSMDQLPLQPVRAEPSDRLFLLLNNNSYSEMKTFTTLGDTGLPDDLADPVLTDLDAGKENNHFNKKRKSNEEPMLSDAIICDQKRPKL